MTKNALTVHCASNSCQTNPKGPVRQAKGKSKTLWVKFVCNRYICRITIKIDESSIETWAWIVNYSHCQKSWEMACRMERKSRKAVCCPAVPQEYRGYGNDEVSWWKMLRYAKASTESVPKIMSRSCNVLMQKTAHTTEQNPGMMKNRKVEWHIEWLSTNCNAQLKQGIRKYSRLSDSMVKMRW